MARKLEAAAAAAAAVIIIVITPTPNTPALLVVCTQNSHTALVMFKGAFTHTRCAGIGWDGLCVAMRCGVFHVHEYSYVYK